MEQPARWWTRGATAALGLLAVALAWDFVHDDGFITLRYAWRFLHGRGLTWTDGPPVEGFTHRSGSPSSLSVPIAYAVARKLRAHQHGRSVWLTWGSQPGGRGASPHGDHQAGQD